MYSLIIAPYPQLTPDQQAVIADDYGMIGGKLNLPVRRALKLYYLRLLHLDEAPATSNAQQLIWFNRAEAGLPQYD